MKLILEEVSMMINIEKDFVKDIPFLHIVNDKQREQTVPTVIFIHGFTSAKEHNLHYAYLLAENGMRVILPEANLHGERANGTKEAELPFHFWGIVTQTIEEIKDIRNKLVFNGWADERIGLAGTSMGGIISLGALTQYDWIKATVCLMGSPTYEQFAKKKLEKINDLGIKVPFSDEELQQQIDSLATYDLSKQSATLAKRPLLFWHGKKDPVVPFQPTYEFYKQIEKDYVDHPDQLQFIVDEQAEHKVSRNGVLKTVEWFKKHL